MKRALCLRVLPMLLAATAVSSAATVQILASANGCVQCGTFALIQPGDTVTFTGYTKAQLVNLAAGTYTITNAAPSGTIPATYEAWQPNATGSWYWDFGAAVDGSGLVLLADQVAGSFASQTAAAAAATSFTDTLTLASQTTLDFYIMDSSIANHSGGIALTFTQVQTGVPEPASFLLVATVLAAGCLRLRRRA